MKYEIDKNGNKYLKVKFGWDDPMAVLKLTFISKNKTIRITKVDNKNHNYFGPEPNVKNIPLLIEALIKIYNDFSEEEIKIE